MPKRTKDYEEDLYKRLKDAKYAAEYLNAVMEDEDDDLKERFLIALRDVAKAHGISHLSQKTDLWRKSLYKILSSKGNPRLYTLIALFNAMGLMMRIEARKKRAV